MKKDQVQMLIIVAAIGVFIFFKVMNKPVKPTMPPLEFAGQIISGLTTGFKGELKLPEKAGKGLDGVLEMTSKDPLDKPGELIKMKEELKGGRSPTEPVNVDSPEMAPVQPGPTVDLKLEGILWGGARNLAIISGEVVAEGEMVESAKVVSIHKDKVVVEINGVITELIRR